MGQKLFNYEPLIEKALRGVIADSLSHAAKNGLVGDQHFYISFLTRFDGVEMPLYLKEEYPEEITIVLQHQFFGLKIFPDRFEVLLTFRTAPEKIVVPFAAITDFMDPSQRFELRFATESAEESTEETKEPTESSKPKKTTKKASKAKDSEPKASDNIVTLDAFRKK